ncbi:MAG: hypothetical protein ACFFDF_23965, partial [Candidatus Odinarchaeota archaeon]
GEATVRGIENIPLRDIIERIEKRKADFGIWISKKGLDHMRTWNGKYDLNDEQDLVFFKRLESHFNITKYSDSGWAFPIKDEDGYLLKVHMHRNDMKGDIEKIIENRIGSLRIFVERHFDPETIFQENYFKIFNFLTMEEHKRLLDAMVDEQTEYPLYQVHLENAGGPKKIVDETFKGAHLSCYVHDGSGDKTWVEVIVDYSMDQQPKFEFKGKEAPTRALRDLVVDAVRTGDSIMQMKTTLRKDHRIQSEKLELANQNIYNTGQMVQLLQKDLMNFHQENLAEISEVQAKLFGMDIGMNVNQVQINNNLIELYNISNKAIEELQNINQTIEQTITEESIDIQETLKEKTDLIIEGQDEIINCVETSKNEIIKKQEEKHLELKQELSEISQKVDELHTFIDKHFKTLKKERRNYLYLILENINRSRELTITEILDTVFLPRQTLVGYLKKLQDKGVIDSEIVKDGRRGRPPKLIKTTRKLDKMIKKIKEVQLKKNGEKKAVKTK